MRPWTLAACALGGWHLWTAYGAETAARLRAVSEALESFLRF